MEEQKDENEIVRPDSLEHTDTEESLRQLWWTIGVTVVGLAVMTYFYF